MPGEIIGRAPRSAVKRRGDTHGNASVTARGTIDEGEGGDEGETLKSDDLDEAAWRTHP